MSQEVVPIIHAPSGETFPLTPENVAKVLLQTAQCPCVATDPVKQQKCKALSADLKMALEDEIKARGDYQLYASQLREAGFDPVFSEIVSAISNDEHEHKEFLELILKKLETVCK